MLLDVFSTFGITGRQAETVLREASITVNRNSIPLDKNGPWYTSGIRIGTPAMTTLGMGSDDMKKIANIIYDVLKNAKPSINKKTNKNSKAKVEIDDKVLESAKKEVNSLLSKFLLYPELIID